VIVWTDDVISSGPDGCGQVHIFWNRFTSEFEVADLGLVKDYIGVVITRDVDKKILRLDHSRHISDIVTKFELNYATTRETPMLARQELPPVLNDEETVNKPYRSLIGSLMYPAVWTRPDIAFAAGTLSQFNHKPSSEHWKAALDVVRYLKGSKSLALEYVDNGNHELVVYADANWAADLVTAKSVYGFALFFGGNLVSWKSRKISRVSTSTTDSEMEGVYNGVTEALWMAGLLIELGIAANRRVKVLCDNKAVVDILNGEKFSERTKHFIVKVEYLREMVRAKEVVIEHVKTEDNTADIFTKSLARVLFAKHVGGLGMKVSDVVEC